MCLLQEECPQCDLHENAAADQAGSLTRIWQDSLMLDSQLLLDDLKMPELNLDLQFNPYQDREKDDRNDDLPTSAFNPLLD